MLFALFNDNGGFARSWPGDWSNHEYLVPFYLAQRFTSYSDTMKLRLRNLIRELIRLRHYQISHIKRACERVIHLYNKTKILVPSFLVNYSIVSYLFYFTPLESI